MTDFTFGADPEVFVKEKGSGRFISAHGMVEGSKENPLIVKDGAVQVDGMALEFNIEPAKTQKQFINNVASVKKQLGEMIGPDLFALVPQATVHFDDDIWAIVPDEARNLGCDPDFNAWLDGRINPRPNADVKFRTGAGHVHIGWTGGKNTGDPDHIQDCILLTKQLDYSLGLWASLVDEDDERRDLYGDYGAFRPKPYGCEYRVLSNFWLNSRELTGKVFNIAKKATKDLAKGNLYFSPRRPNRDFLRYSMPYDKKRILQDNGFGRYV